MKNDKKPIKPAAVNAQNTAVKPAAKPKPSSPKVAAPGPLPGARSTVCLELYAPKAREVFVAGTFNGWQTGDTPLYRQGQGRRTRELTLPPGQHEYLFWVDGAWQTDPQAKEHIPNPFGGRNCLLIIPRPS